MADDDSGDRDASGGDDAQWDRSSAWDDSDTWGGADSDERFGSDADSDARLEDEGGDEPDAATDDRIPLDLSRDRGDADADADPGTSGDADDSYEPEPNSTPIESGDPDLENVVFVVIGAIAMLLVIARLASLPL